MLQEKINNIIEYLQEYVKDGEIADTSTLYDKLSEEVDTAVIYYNDVYNIIKYGDIYDLTEFTHCENLGEIAFEVLHDNIIEDLEFSALVEYLENLEN